ncbi:BTAD domain-containing putative transcriptional regulator [Streptomyces sp. NPDC058202]|uniref:AfsR/SARP family transcriptional regulator n=1 Tax=Streptomyces sp. NPDC058202 TaxID=3346380 RepID=UPI0036E6C5BD
MRSKLSLEADNVLLTRGSAYSVEAMTDAQRFQDMVRRADQRHAAGELARAAEDYGAALSLWRGEVLPDVGDQSVRSEVSALEHQRRGAQLNRLKVLLRLGVSADVLGGAEQLLVEDPFWEELLRIKVQALYQTQGSHAASVLMRQISKELAEQGLDPSPEWMSLAERVLKHDLPVAPAVPAQRTPDAASVGSGAEDLLIDNIPPATYAKFVGRPMPWTRLEEGVSQGLPVVSLIGIGGSGKSTLAREFAVRQLQERTRFHGVVWVSDREQAGSTTLATVLDTIALTADYPGLLALDPAQKSHQVLRLLRRTPILLVIDNHETIKDQALDNWLSSIPEPSKALVTSITHSQRLAPHSFPIDVLGLTVEESRAFYAQCLNRLGLRELLAQAGELDALCGVAQGSPRLIEWAIGQVKRRGRTLNEVADEIRSAPQQDLTGDVVLRDLFRASWTSLTDPARRVLGSLACFPYGVDRETLRQVSGCGGDLEGVLEELTDFCFISRQTQPDTALPYYVAYPLATNRPSMSQSAFMPAIRGRWLQHFVDLTRQVGFCPEDIDRLRLLDAPGLRSNLEYTLTWACANHQWDAIVQISREARYFYYVRGLWGTQPNIHLMRADAARRLRDTAEEFDALVYYLNIAAKQENQAATQALLPRIEALLSSSAHAYDSKQMGEYRHALALHLLTQHRLVEAESQWRENLRAPELLGEANYSANLRWLAICLARAGRPDEARTLFAQARQHARDHGYRRAELLIDLQVAEMLLDTDTRLPVAQQVITDLTDRNGQIASAADRRYQADQRWLLGQAHQRLGNLRQASKFLRQAAELYSKLGLVDRANRARTLDAACSTPPRRMP